MKKRFCLLLAVVMMLTLFAGCQNKNKNHELEGIRWKSQLYGDIWLLEDGQFTYENYGIQIQYEILEVKENEDSKTYKLLLTDTAFPEQQEEAEYTVSGRTMYFKDETLTLVD